MKTKNFKESYHGNELKLAYVFNFFKNIKLLINLLQIILLNNLNQFVAITTY
jgi:hypothetical protein